MICKHNLFSQLTVLQCSFFFTKVGKSLILILLPLDKTPSKLFLCEYGDYLLYSRCLSTFNILPKGLENAGSLNEIYVMLRDLRHYWANVLD